MVSLPLEIATGDGFRIGYEGDPRHEEVGRSSSYLKRVMSDRSSRTYRNCTSGNRSFCLLSQIGCSIKVCGG